MSFDLASRSTFACGHGACRMACLALLLLSIAVAFSSCRTEATNQDYNYNNPLDPNQGDDDDEPGTGQLVIAYLDSLNDVLLIVNTGIEDTDMSGWTLENDDAVVVYTFSGFTLDSAAYVRVHSGTGSDNSTDLYTGSATPNWGSDPDHHAILRDADGDAISDCEDVDTCWQ